MEIRIKNTVGMNHLKKSYVYYSFFHCIFKRSRENYEKTATTAEMVPEYNLANLFIRLQLLSCAM